MRSDSFVFKMPPDLKELVPHFQKDLAEYVRVNNDYFKCKISEEKAKAKKPKFNNDGQLASKYETLEVSNELRTIVDKLLKTLPENLHQPMAKHLNIAFGLAQASLNAPAIGQLWSTIVHWPCGAKKPSSQPMQVN